MIRMITFGLWCMIIFHTYYFFRKRLQKIPQGREEEESRANTEQQGTLVKDSSTGEYYVR